MMIRALGCLLCTLSLSVYADYSVEFQTAALSERLTWDDSSFFTVNDVHSSGVSATANLYFYDVKQQGPWAESAYLQRAGYLQLQGARREQEYRLSPALEKNADSAHAKAWIVIEDMIIWDIRAGQSQSAFAPATESTEHSQLHFGIGSYFLDNHSLVISFQYNDIKVDNTSRLDTRGLLVDYRSVLALGKQHLAFGGGIGLHWGEYDKRYSYVGKDVEAVRFAMNGFVSYYPLENLGLTLALALDANSDVHDDALDTTENDTAAQLSLGVRYFPMQWLSLDANVYAGNRQLLYEDDNTDEDIRARLRGATLGVTVRF